MIRRDRALIGILAMTACLHVVGMIRTPLPSQDGLKFIRIAREFGHQPWADVVRRADQHPLYPALIAAAHPIVAAFDGESPDSWRIAAQGVSALAMVALVVPFHRFARELVGRRAALLATLLLVLLPLSGRIGHETLSDATGLLCFVGALCLGTVALRTGRIAAAVGSGAIAGLGYLARPEVALLPIVIASVCFAGSVLGVRVRMGEGTSRRAAEARRSGDREGGERISPRHLSSPPLLRASAALREVPSGSRLPRPAGMVLAFAIVSPLLVCIASYSAIKGTISEKHSMRYATGLGRGTGMARTALPWLPPGLDDPRWDFSPKEESDAPGPLGPVATAAIVGEGIGEAMAWVPVLLAFVGSWGLRHRRRTRPARWLVGIFAVTFLAVLVRHAMQAGYLSDRHCAMLAVVATPWAAAGATRLARSFVDRLAFAPGRRHRLAIVAITLVSLTGVVLQLKPGHPSRWGHQAAGLWLADRAEPGEAVLDTRGWAAFVSGLRSYDPWHIRQALTDSNLAYVVIGDDELTAGSRRAETFAALLNFAAEPVAAFPERQGGEDIGVRVYRFRRPESWEGIAR